MVCAIASIPAVGRLCCIRRSLWRRFTRYRTPISALPHSSNRVRDILGDSIFHIFHHREVCNRLYLHPLGSAKTDSNPDICQHEYYGYRRNTRLSICVRQLHASCGDLESITVSSCPPKHYSRGEAQLILILLSLRGTCQKTLSLQTVSYIVSAIQMATDWVCAGIPFIIVAGLQMSRRKKVSVICILGLGIFASVATCVRMPYLKYYDTTKYPTEIACKCDTHSPIVLFGADQDGKRRSSWGHQHHLEY